MGPLVLVLSPLPLLAALARASEPWRALERKAVGAQAPGGGPELGNTSGIRQWLSTTCRAQGQVNLDGPVSVIGFLCINAECLFEAAQCPYAEHYRARGLTMSSDLPQGLKAFELSCFAGLTGIHALCCPSLESYLVWNFVQLLQYVRAIMSLPLILSAGVVLCHKDDEIEDWKWWILQ